MNRSPAVRELILESEDMTSILTQANLDTLVIFDIDNTLMRPKTYYGSDEWFFYLEKKLNSLKEAEKIWNEVQYKIEPSLVDDKVPSEILKIQNIGIKTLGLTARTIEISDITEIHLKKLGINLNKNNWLNQIWKKEGIFFNSPDTPTLHNSIIYAGETNSKGVVFKCFYEEVLKNDGIKKIIFFDDKTKHIQSMSNVFKELDKIHFTGVRYSKTDELTIPFLKDPTLYIKNFS